MNEWKDGWLEGYMETSVFASRPDTSYGMNCEQSLAVIYIFSKLRGTFWYVWNKN
jgi:hypothetical protein